MAHLNGHSLKTWKKGDDLRAIDLNGNFQAIAGMAESAMARALQPDEPVVMLEMALAHQAQRIVALERLANLHERQRNEKEWAPLSHLGAVLQRVNDLQRNIDAAVARLEDLHAGLLVDHDDLHRRIARLEQQPDAAEKEEFVILAGDHERLRLKEHMLLAQVIALRHEVTILRDLALGRDRVANRLEYAPMSYVGAILQRLAEMEKRLPPEEEPASSLRVGAK